MQDRRPPKLEVAFPGGIVNSGEIAITGSTEPGTRIIVGGTEVEVDDVGRFTHLLKLNKGVNLVVVEAVDGAGNVAYSSRTFTAQ